MNPAIRLAFAAVLLACAGASPSQACTPIEIEDGQGGRRPRTDEELYAFAKSVFVAHVTRAEEVTKIYPGTSKQVAAAEATVRVVEILKGDPPIDGKVWSSLLRPTAISCDVPFFVGWDYLFFLVPEADGFVSFSTGTRGIVGDAESRALLAKLRALNK